MGRPRKPAAEKLSARRSVALEPIAIAAIKRACAVTRIGVDTYIRAAVYEKLYREGWWKPPEHNG